MLPTLLGKLSLLGVLVSLVAPQAVQAVSAPADLAWPAPHRYRVRLAVDPRGRERSNSPASVELDLLRILAERGVGGELDESSIEIVGVEVRRP